MYTEKSVDLKRDFYARYGKTSGRLFFKKVGLPCTIFDGGKNSLMLTLDCGVRVYGRQCGDVLKVLNCDTNVCDVHFVKNGRGAQILYSVDIPDVKGMKDTVLYAINAVLREMGSTGRLIGEYDTVALCEKYAPYGWCAVKEGDTAKSIPMPLGEYNIILMRTRKNRLVAPAELTDRFHISEYERIKASVTGLKECRTDAFFDMVNESQNSVERLLSPSEELMQGINAVRSADGVCASKICNRGIIAFCEKDRTDSAIIRINNEYKSAMGYSPNLAVVK